MKMSDLAVHSIQKNLLSDVVENQINKAKSIRTHTHTHTQIWNEINNNVKVLLF